MKKVIFVGGTPRSGSTYLDLILSNDPKGFSIGEIYFMYHPTSSHHCKPTCSCGDKSCVFWKKLRNKKPEVAYDKVFKEFGVDFIVDSSKNPVWINRMNKILKQKGYDVQNVLIWKTPSELIESYLKRNSTIKDAIREWTNYHLTYFDLVKHFSSIKYNTMKDKNELRKICDNIGIRYSKEKYNYWNKTHHTLFGSSTAKQYLYQEGTDELKKMKSILNKQSKKDIDTRCLKKIIKNKHIKILKFLEKNGIKSNKDFINPQLVGREYTRHYIKQLLFKFK